MKLTAFLLSAGLLAGCTTPGPDFEHEKFLQPNELGVSCGGYVTTNAAHLFWIHCSFRNLTGKDVKVELKSVKWLPSPKALTFATMKDIRKLAADDNRRRKGALAFSIAVGLFSTAAGAGGAAGSGAFTSEDELGGEKGGFGVEHLLGPAVTVWAESSRTKSAVLLSKGEQTKIKEAELCFKKPVEKCLTVRLGDAGSSLVGNYQFAAAEVRPKARPAAKASVPVRLVVSDRREPHGLESPLAGETSDNLKKALPNLKTTSDKNAKIQVFVDIMKSEFEFTTPTWKGTNSWQVRVLDKSKGKPRKVSRDIVVKLNEVNVSGGVSGNEAMKSSYEKAFGQAADFIADSLNAR